MFSVNQFAVTSKKHKLKLFRFSAITSDLSYFADLFAFLKKCYLVLKYFSEG